MTGTIRYFTLDFNCGFARTEVRELTPRGRWKDESHTTKRTTEFKELFHDCEHFGLQATYFESKPNLSDFDRDCTNILKLWSNRWNPSGNKKEYEETFSTTRWKNLPMEEKQLHTLRNCRGCYTKFGEAQWLFPQGPHHVHDPIVSVDTKQLQILGKKQATCEALREINAAFSETYSTTFTDSMVKHGQQGVQKRPTADVRKKKLRNIYRRCRDKENQALKSAAAICLSRR